MCVCPDGSWGTAGDKQSFASLKEHTGQPSYVLRLFTALEIWISLQPVSCVMNSTLVTSQGEKKSTACGHDMEQS